jgi:hybrid cluster-associated redox disulfide protein
MRITKEMTIFETIRSHPKAMNVFKSYDMPCSGCLAVMDESIEKGAKRHGRDLERLLEELNGLFGQEGDERPI